MPCAGAYPDDDYPIVVRVVVTAGLPSDVRAFARVEFVRAIGSEDRSATNADAGPPHPRVMVRSRSRAMGRLLLSPKRRCRRPIKPGPAPDQRPLFPSRGDPGSLAVPMKPLLLDLSGCLSAVPFSWLTTRRPGGRSRALRRGRGLRVMDLCARRSYLVDRHARRKSAE
jgi:hypothetical protein